MPWQCWRVAQLGGLALSFVGWVSSCVATSVPLWKSLNLDLNVLEVWQAGLWHVCVVREGSASECKRHPSLLALPRDVWLSRLLMVASNASGFLALSLSLLGSGWLKAGGRKPALRRGLAAAGGTLSCLSGLATSVPVSWVAYDVVREFRDEALPEIMPRWELGSALFLGWFAGLSLLLGGSLLLSSACSTEVKGPPGRLTANRTQEGRRPPTRRYHPPAPKDVYLAV